MPNEFERLLHQPNTALLRNPDGFGFWLFDNPVTVLAAHSIEDVLPVISEAEKITQHSGHYAVGYIAYEAARAFDSALRTRAPAPFPLVWFAIYTNPHAISRENLSDIPCARHRPHFEPDTSATNYRHAISRIRDYIAAGDTYQVNYTLRLTAEWPEEPLSIFARLYPAQPSPLSAFLRLSEMAVCSFSPELFFDLGATTIVCRPMKGTRPRGLRQNDDARHGKDLQTSPKDRAENLMILDMMRNDLGRIAITGSVRVRSLFDVEKLPTVWQMTSTVTAETRAPILEILRALFPCASVTGAPKARTMELIAELETSPRGVYTGALGFIAPARRARFSVAIRTLTIHGQGGAEYGTGGGIVWDSTPQTEYAEAITKARIIFEDIPHFELLETLRWEAARGFFFENQHLDRMASSADYFDFSFNHEAARRALRKTIGKGASNACRVRLLLSKDGQFRAECHPISYAFHSEPSNRCPTWTVALAREPVRSTNGFLYHKTTNRELYERAKANMRMDDILLWNEHRCITEFTTANVVAVFGRDWITPPIADGLLSGVFREHLLRSGRIKEGSLPVERLAQADAIYLINSVRGWIRCRLVSRT